MRLMWLGSRLRLFLGPNIQMHPDSLSTNSRG